LSDRTNAERQARFRAKRDQRIKDLEATLTAGQPEAPLRNDSGLGKRVEELEAALAAAKAALQQERRRRAHAEAGAASRDRRIKALEAEVQQEQHQRERAEREAAKARATATPPRPESEQVELLRRQLKGAQTQLRNERASHQHTRERFAQQGKVLLDERGYKLIKSCLHPDRVADDPDLLKKYHEAFTLFENLGLARSKTK
jgi:hypothetical protein